MPTERCTRCKAAVVPGSALCRACVGQGRTSGAEKSGAEKRATRGKRYRVAGDTYPHKETLKALGAGWEPSIRMWILTEPDDKVIVKIAKLGLGLEEV